MITEANSVNFELNTYPNQPQYPHKEMTGFYFEGDRAAAKLAFNQLITLAEKGNGLINWVKWERCYSVDGADIEDDAFETVGQWPAPAGGGSAT